MFVHGHDLSCAVRPVGFVLCLTTSGATALILFTHEIVCIDTGAIQADSSCMQSDKGEGGHALSEQSADGAISSQSTGVAAPPAPLPRARLVLCDADLRLRPQLPRPAAARHPRQADPGRAAHHRRAARADRRALLRDVLLLHRDPGRLARGPDQPGRACCRLACAIWSAATIACGLARNLSAARGCTDDASAFGEAGGVPPSYALITDTFPPGRRGMAFGIYNLGPPIGAALGIAFGATRSPPHSTGATLSSRSASSGSSRPSPCRSSYASRPAARPIRPSKAGHERSGRSGKRCRPFFRKPTLVPRRVGQRGDAVRHLRPRQFRDAVPDAREGHDAARRSRSGTRSSSLFGMGGRNAGFGPGRSTG